MKYYSREVTKRVEINRFGKLGYKSFVEFIKTNNIDNFNKGKQIKFIEGAEFKKELRHLDVDKVYSYDIKDARIVY